MSLLEKMQDGEGIIHVRITCRKLADEDQAQQFGGELFKIIEEDVTEPCELHLDYAEVEYQSSSFLGKLITAQNKLKAKGSKLVICNPTEDQVDLYQITKLNTHFEVRERGKV